MGLGALGQQILNFWIGEHEYLCPGLKFVNKACDLKSYSYPFCSALSMEVRVAETETDVD